MDASVDGGTLRGGVLWEWEWAIGDLRPGHPRSPNAAARSEVSSLSVGAKQWLRPDKQLDLVSNFIAVGASRIGSVEEDRTASWIS